MGEWRKFLKLLKKNGLLVDFFKILSEESGLRWYGDVLSYVEHVLKKMSVREFLVKNIIHSYAKGRCKYIGVLSEWLENVETTLSTSKKN